MAKVNKKKHKGVPKDKAIVLVPPDPNAFVKDDICALLEEGMWKRDAALLSGISEMTFYRWCKEDVSFDSRVEASILKYKRNLIKVINVGSIRRPDIAIRVMEQRWPKEWRPTSAVEIVDPDKQLSDTFNKLLGKGTPPKEELINDSDEPNITEPTNPVPGTDKEEAT